MKKITLASLTLSVTLLTACSGVSAGTQTSSTQPGNSLTMATQLVVGTLNLEDTEQAITGEQAKELLPLWQVYQSLTDSGAAAQAEIDGLVEQIQETMTAEQMKAISSMNLTQQNVFAVMQEQGGDFMQAPESVSNSSTQSGGFTPPDGGGGMAGSAPPDGGMDGAGPVASAGQDRETAASTGLVRNVGVPAPLVQALIQVLEQKTDS